jgi:hypothetical protein
VRGIGSHLARISPVRDRHFAIGRAPFPNHPLVSRSGGIRATFFLPLFYPYKKRGGRSVGLAAPLRRPHSDRALLSSILTSPPTPIKRGVSGSARHCALYFTRPPQALSHPPTPRLPRQALYPWTRPFPKEHRHRVRVCERKGRPAHPIIRPESFPASRVPACHTKTNRRRSAQA